MNAGGAGYLLETPYTGDFYSHLSPAWMSYIARINGCSGPSLEGGFDWCELGCGLGRTAALLAATHPEGRFQACDINVQHIQKANALREAAGLSNVAFHLASIRQMLDLPTPDFDFITLHGVYSWVPQEVREQIHEFVRRKLKPGGLVLLSYNAMPGWAHMQPLKRLLNEHAEQAQGTAFERAQIAFDQVRSLAQAGAAFFVVNPAAARHLDQLATKDIRYIVHEYLTPHNNAFYFKDVAGSFSAMGLDFAGSMTPADNYLDLMVPPAFRERLSGNGDRLTTEALRDFVMDTSFRKDLFAKRKERQTTGAVTLEDFKGLAFSLADVPERLPMQSREGSLSFDLAGRRQSVQRIHALMKDGPVSALAIHGVAGGSTSEDLAFLLQELVVTGHIVPCAPCRSETGWSGVHEAMLDFALRERLTQVPMACSNHSSASYFDPVESVLLAALAHNADEETCAQTSLSRLSRSGYPVHRVDSAGRRREAADTEILEYARRWWRDLRDPEGLPARRLKLMGILA